MRRPLPFHRPGRFANGALAALLAGMLCCGCGKTEEASGFDSLRTLPATITGELTLSAFGANAPAIGTLTTGSDSILVNADLATVARAGIRLTFGAEYRGQHTVTLEAAEHSDPDMPQYRITRIAPPG